MIPLVLIPCRWRGKELSSDGERFACDSPKIRSATGVTKDLCANCYLRDHEPSTPSALQQAVNLAKSVSQHIINNLKRVPEEERKRRISVCESCPQFTKGRSCGLCGCSMDIKAGWEEQTCPCCSNCHKSRYECKCSEFKSKWEK